ncbi:interferon-induced very large GTPase 1-like [Sinocyclocheilus rhinocerous]|uniref:interferon-induced very large GTPase 1-like n=1 Tax=Sinocyclocheilus rhinocerous TaxID=307959 RepID=UPI0007BACD67|nr:PREDICTED: interferon-induced very large GTPase 1-like [Sinocyclocheilus rhinocerous]
METENKLHNKIKNEAVHEVDETELQRELKKTSEEVEKSMSEFFEKDKDKDILIQWKTSFEIKIKELRENIVRETKRKLNGILEQRDQKKKIEAKRTAHENTLYEKSKELPLKLKDKANDEETLKKEFDLFWEQSADKIISDTPPNNDIDIMRDVIKILSDIYEGRLPADHFKKDSEFINIFTVWSFFDYVIFKKSKKKGVKEALKDVYRTMKETFGHIRTLSPENEAQIRSLVTDVDQHTDTMIQSFNISKMGYNISCTQKLIDYIKKRVTEHQEGPVKYEFKNEFFIDLVLSICKKSNKMNNDQHIHFKEAIYVEKREEYYSIFQKYCHGATSVAIFGEIICQKLKEPFEQSVYKKTARDLTDEMRSNCESLNGNRSNLEKHILKALAEEEDFDKYMNYIDNPRDHFKSFIRDEVSRYITDKFSVSVLHKMKMNIELLQQKIMEAAHESTEHVQVTVYRKLETEYSKWSWSLRSAMMESENKLHNKIENEAIHEVEETDLQRELKKTSEEVEKSMSEFFEKDKDKDILIQWKTSFEIKIKELRENIVRETKRKLNGILDAQRTLKKMIEVQRTAHENTLYEKSKELAFKIKDKANDEETLKKEFDLFWEQSADKIISDTPPNNDIDIMRDVIKILSDIYEGRLPADHFKKDSEFINIFTVWSFFDYVIFKKSKKKGVKEALKDVYRTMKETFGHIRTLSPENEAQIRSLVTDVDQHTDKMIQSFNISKMGYNISDIQQLIDYIKARVIKHQEGPVKYEFKKKFFIDLVLSICKKANKMIADQHRLFRDANDPVIYVEKKREECYSIFQKYCNEAPSAAIFGEIICQKLKEPIEQSVYKKTARDLTYKIMKNCESLNGNRLNLEKHILKTLAEEEDFNKYMNYIHNARDHFSGFIRDEVSRYITDQFSVSVLPKMKENIKLLQQKIMKAAHESTEHVQVNRGDAGLWLKSFTQQLSNELIFSEKHLSGEKHHDVDDFNLLEDVIKKDLTAIMSDISNSFNTETFPVKLDYKFRPHELLTDHFCQCCWVQCPFCKAICTNTIGNHHGDHNTPFHRSIGLNGIYFNNTSHLSTYICTSAEASSIQYFCPNDSIDEVPWRDYRRAGGVYADWSTPPDLSDLPYWKWFVCRFKKDLEKHHKKTFEGQGKIPDEWKKYSKLDAIESLDNYI